MAFDPDLPLQAMGLFGKKKSLPDLIDLACTRKKQRPVKEFGEIWREIKKMENNLIVDRIFSKKLCESRKRGNTLELLDLIEFCVHMKDESFLEVIMNGETVTVLSSLAKEFKHSLERRSPVVYYIKTWAQSTRECLPSSRLQALYARLFQSSAGYEEAQEEAFEDQESPASCGHNIVSTGVEELCFLCEKICCKKCISRLGEGEEGAGLMLCEMCRQRPSEDIRRKEEAIRAAESVYLGSKASASDSSGAQMQRTANRHGSLNVAGEGIHRKVAYLTPEEERTMDFFQGVCFKIKSREFSNYNNTYVQGLYSDIQEVRKKVQGLLKNRSNDIFDLFRKVSDLIVYFEHAKASFIETAPEKA